MSSGRGKRIVKTEVKTFKTAIVCYRCNIEMEKSDVVLISSPPQYQYTCPKCNHYETSHTIFPIIEYIPEVDDEQR